MESLCNPNSDQGRFAAWMAQLKSCYPSYRPTPVEWRAQVSSYWRGLSSFSEDVVRITLAKCPGKHPEWFPSLGQLQIIAKDQAKREAAHQEHQRRKMLPPSPMATSPNPENPFNMLAEKWEQENRSRPTGDEHERGLRRMKEFWQTWDIAEKWWAAKKQSKPADTAGASGARQGRRRAASATGEPTPTTSSTSDGEKKTA